MSALLRPWGEWRHKSGTPSRRAGALVLTGATLLMLPATATAVDTVGVTEQVSVSSAGEDGNGNANREGSSLSADGRYVAFSSEADNLVPDDTNDTSDVFVRDRLTGTTERVSVTSSGKEGDSASNGGSISADGRYVAFSSAVRFVGGDSGFDTDAFVHDRLTGETTLVSVASDGTEASARGAGISGNGRYVSFTSDAEVLNGPATFPDFQVFVHDRQTGVTEMVSVAPDGTPAEGGAGGGGLSADGRFVYFSSSATNLVPVEGEREGARDLFLYDRQTDTMTAITSTIDVDTTTTNKATQGAISPNGRYVTFTADSDGFITPDTNGFVEDAWLVDTHTDPFTYTLVSRNDAGEQANRDSRASSVSNDGRFVAFRSLGTNLDGPAEFGSHVYLRDVVAGTTRVVSVPPGGGEFGAESFGASMTPDGRVLTFYVEFLDTFVRDMRPATDLDLSMTDTPDPVLERDQVTYTVTVHNNGPTEAANTTLVDTLPADPTFVSATTDEGTCERDVNSNSGGVLTCGLGTLAANDSATVTIVLEPRGAGTLGNLATVDAFTPDNNTTNNTAGQTTTVTPR